MKKLKNQILLVLAILVAGVGTAYAQNFQGIATYQTAMNGSNFSMKGEGITPEMEKQIAAAVKKQGQKEYTLNFNLSEANWEEVESLGNGPVTASSGMQVMTVSSGGGGLKYRNTAENLYLEEASLFGKPFLVKDELKPLEWVLTDETKQIGEYTVQKATYTRTVERSVFGFGLDTEDKDKEPETTMDTIKVEAWYTPQIPVSHGPDNYWGLPGLILELSDGSRTMLCTKVALNPEGGIEIKKPKKGKKVSRAEYAEIQKEKMKEMSEKYSGGGGGTVFKIRGGN